VTQKSFQLLYGVLIASLPLDEAPNSSAADRSMWFLAAFLFGGGLIVLVARRHLRSIGRVMAGCMAAGLLAVSASAQISDTTPPVLAAFSFTPDAVTAIGGPGIVTVTARFTDDLSGIPFAVTGQFVSPSFQFQDVSMLRISGDESDGVYQGQLSIPEFSESGIWKARAYAFDAVSNLGFFDTAALAGLGFPTDLTVTSIQDITAPTLTAVTFTPTPVDVSGGPQAVNIALTISDDVSGVDLVNQQSFDFTITLLSPGAIQRQRITNRDFSLTAGDSLAGIWEASITLPSLSEAGPWSIEFIILRDLVSNQSFLDTFNLQALGIATTFDVISSPEDTTPPSLVDLTFTPAFINTSTGSQNVVVRYSLSDDLSGVAFLPDSPIGTTYRGAIFTSPSGQQSRTAFPFGNSFPLVSGDALNGVWESTLFFPQFSEDGDWRISNFWVQDVVRNSLQLTTADLDARGVPRLVIVRPSLNSDGIVDPTAGGVIQDDSFGNRAQVSVPAGLFTDSTDVAIDVFAEPLNIPNPTGFSAPGTLFVNIELTPQPAFPLAAPGLTIVLPVENPLPPGSALSLFKVDTASGLLVPAIGVSGLPVVGMVDPSSLSATFAGIASLSTVVGLIPVAPCDANADGKIDIADIQAITQARNTTVQPGDPRDVDGDGRITVLDARQCTLRCTNPRCAP
jgi:hypothetical protein